MNGRALRWKRKENPAPLILQERDKEIMVSLYAFRFLTREQIQRLFGLNCTRKANQRLRALYDHHYLSRSLIPADHQGSGKAIYFLGNKGIEITAQELGIDPLPITRKVKELSTLKEFFLTHEIQINDVRISFSMNIQSHPNMSFERWINDTDCQQGYHLNYRGRKIYKKFRPDGYFRFLCHKRLYSFFLELDRSTMSNSRFKNKVKSYLEFFKLGFYEKRFGVKYFQVLVVTTSLERLSNLKKTVEEVTDKSFWFTTLDCIYTKNVFSSIWQKSGQNGLFPLIKEVG